MTYRIVAARQIKFEILAAMEVNERITDRDKIIIRRVLDGETYKSVAADFDICGERVREICFCAFRKRLGLKL
jgi:DNA-directed RNA polymerase sigma subunit (sigma70/sigma32)